LIELAGTRLFDQIWGIPPYEDYYRKKDNYIGPELAANKLFKRMKDCEIILRFLAFRHADQIKGSVRSILDSYMKENRDAGPQEIDALRGAFHNSLRIAHAIFGERTFRIRVKGTWQLSQPLFDAVMVAVENLAKREDRLVANKKEILADLVKQTKKKAVYEIIVGRPNTAVAVKERISIVRNLMGQFC
jgi:hypothetical protein